MTDAPGGEFRNPYAPLPRAPFGTGTASEPSTPGRGSTTAPVLPTHPQQGGVPVAPGEGGHTVPASTPPTVPVPDPWHAMVALSGSAPAMPRRRLRVGVFTLREILIIVLGLAQLGAAFISVAPGAYHPVVALGVLWAMIIALPTVAVIVVVVRRCWAPQLRVGMFSVDAFVAAASVSALLGWLNVMSLGPVAWFGCLLAVGFVVVSVAGSLIPGLREDFTDRPAALSHPAERPVRARAGESAIRADEAIIVSVAAAAAPAPAEPVRAGTMFPAAGPFRHPVPRVSDREQPDGETVAQPAVSGEAMHGHGLSSASGSATPNDVGAPGAAPAAASMRAVAPTATSAESTVPSEDAAGTRVGDEPTREDAAGPAHRGFWILVPEQRIAVDPLGRPMFPLVPSAWTLALEDRGDRLLVRSADGRVGVLTDLTGVIRN